MEYTLIFKEDYVIDVSYDFSPMRKNTYSINKIEELSGRELSNAEDAKRKKLGIASWGRAPKLTKKERMVENTYTYKKLFNKGDEFNTISGVNILVGDNGCGKSTLLREFLKQNRIKNTIYVDLEKANPKISKPNPENGDAYSGHEVLNMFMWAVESHGETREGVLLNVLSHEFNLLILDEPEQGLSLKNQKKYIDALKNLNKDIIVITHSKVFIENVENIFDVETMKWVNSKEYLENI